MFPFLVSIPIFLVIFIGWLFRKYRIVDEVWIHILNQFAYYVSLPALILSNFWNIDFSDSDFLHLIGWSLLVIVSLMLVVFLILSLLKINYKTKVAIFLIICTGNSIYMGFPIIAGAFGQGILSAGSIVAVIYLIAPILASIFVMQLWSKNKQSLASQVLDFIKNPLTISTIAGIVISFIPKQFFGVDAIYKSMTMLGATASPVALFALGSFLYSRLLKRNLAEVISLSVIKVFIFPLAIFIFGAGIIQGDVIRLLILMAAMPTAVTTFIISEKFSLDDTLVGNALLISTVLSFFAIPFALAYLI